MTLVSEILVSAYRDANLIKIGGTPNPAEQAEGLSRLQSIVASVFGNEAGENYSDWSLGNYGRDTQDYFSTGDIALLNFPCGNSRMIATAETSQTVKFPARPNDGARMALIDPYSRLADVPMTFDGNGRTIGGQSTFLANEAGMEIEWFFRADKGDWVKMSGLDSFDEMPFPPMFDDYFIITLATRLNPQNGRSTSPESVLRLKQQQRQLYAKYTQSAPLDVNADLDRLSQQSYNRSAFSSSRGAWNTGSFRGN